MKHRRRQMAYLYWSLTGVIFLAAFLYWFIVWRTKAYTDDAYVGGNQVYITPLHDGFVTGIHTDDTFLVKQGELLVDLDRTDSLIAFDRAKVNLAETVRKVCQLFHQVFVYQSEIEAKKAAFISAAQDFEHRFGVVTVSGVSLEDYEHSVALLRSSFYALQTTETLLDKALSLVRGTAIQDHPLVKAAVDQMRDAWIHLYRCRIYSPVEGLAAQRSIQVGMWIPSGTPLMSVIPLDQIWVNANFKETQARHMKIGQRVRLTSDLYGDTVIFHGKIAGLPGVAGNAVSLLPPQNLSGNWIKIVQRLPVRVELDPEELKKHPLRIGLSMEATVDLTDPGDLVPQSTAGSPRYATSIFNKEEIGESEFIDTVIADNFDPSLETYLTQKLYVDTSPLRVPSTILSAIAFNVLNPFAPPLPAPVNERFQAESEIQLEREVEMKKKPAKEDLAAATVADADPKAITHQPQFPLSEPPEIPVLLTDQMRIPSQQELINALTGFSMDEVLNQALHCATDR